MKCGKKGLFVLTAPLSPLRGAVSPPRSHCCGTVGCHRAAAAAGGNLRVGSAVPQVASMGTVPKDVLQGGDAPGWPVCLLTTRSTQFEKSFEVDRWEVLNKMGAPLSRESDDMEIRCESRKCVSWIGKQTCVLIYCDLQYIYADYLLHCKVLNSKESFHQREVLRQCLLMAHFSMYHPERSQGWQCIPQPSVLLGCQMASGRLLLLRTGCKHARWLTWLDKSWFCITGKQISSNQLGHFVGSQFCKVLRSFSRSVYKKPTRSVFLKQYDRGLFFLLYYFSCTQNTFFPNPSHL